MILKSLFFLLFLSLLVSCKSYYVETNSIQESGYQLVSEDKKTNSTATISKKESFVVSLFQKKYYRIAKFKENGSYGIINTIAILNNTDKVLEFSADNLKIFDEQKNEIKIFTLEEASEKFNKISDDLLAREEKQLDYRKTDSGGGFFDAIALGSNIANQVNKNKSNGADKKQYYQRRIDAYHSEQKQQNVYFAKNTPETEAEIEKQKVAIRNKYKKQKEDFASNYIKPTKINPGQQQSFEFQFKLTDLTKDDKKFFIEVMLDGEKHAFSFSNKIIEK
ncbi:MAG: hypothetical protein ACK5BE_04720 [Alphaproteobacteria bacterium]|jgi:hypothetical protein